MLWFAYCMMAIVEECVRITFHWVVACPLLFRRFCFGGIAFGTWNVLVIDMAAGSQSMQQVFLPLYSCRIQTI